MSNSIHERFYKKIIYIVEGKDYIKFFNNITTNKIEFRSDNEMIRTLWLNNKEELFMIYQLAGLIIQTQMLY